MSSPSPEPPFHLLLHADERTVTTTALKLLISDEAHEELIRDLAREVLAKLDGEFDERGILTVELGSRQMKIVHTALRALFGDLGREQADERELIRGVLDKLPDEHVMRAISLD
ncbi:MAG TPA: hypothetical protein VMB05_15510 [Solirubrobacteraceae bacterium]|nr:hypothetical protein [Solirubrobacteraceae bacterium]